MAREDEDNELLASAEVVSLLSLQAASAARSDVLSCVVRLPEANAPGTDPNAANAWNNEMNQRTPSTRNALAPAPTNRALEVGQKVLAGLAKGRAAALAEARERAAQRLSMVLILANDARAKGAPVRGMARRIADKLQGELSERQVKRYLDTHYGMSDSPRHTARNPGGLTHVQ